MRIYQSLRMLWPAHGLAYLGGNDDRQGDSGADQPLPDVEPGGLRHGVEYAQDVDRTSRTRDTAVVMANVLSPNVSRENVDSRSFVGSIEKNRLNRPNVTISAP